MYVIFFDNIFLGIFIFVKDLVRYQNFFLKLNDYKKNQFLEMIVFNNKNIFQFIMLVEVIIFNNFFDISVIKFKKDGLKNKVNYELLGKIF